ncbi:TPA: hypothetical protein ACSTLU_004403 [Serratia fonticola]
MDKSKAVWTNEKSDEAIMRLMTDCGMPENTTLYRAFKQLENEIVQSAWAAQKEKDPRIGKPSWDSHSWPQIVQSAGGHWYGVKAGWEMAIQSNVKGDDICLLSADGEFLTYGQPSKNWRESLEKRPVSMAAAERANNVPDDQRWCPDVDPITGRKLFMWLNHPDLGYVPTYGGPYDSYTLAERDNAGGFSVHRYDHDRGAWVEDECVCVQVVEEWLPSDQVELDEYVKENAPGAERSADPGLQHPIITSPDTDPRRGDFKCESTGEFYRTQMGSVPGREFMLYRNEAESLYLGLREALCSTEKEA